MTRQPGPYEGLIRSRCQDCPRGCQATDNAAGRVVLAAWEAAHARACDAARAAA